MQAAETPLIAQGRALFNDVKLSGDGKWSCASCHPNHGHTNNKTYVGVDVVPDGDPLGRSTPTLWGAGTRQAFSWAGTAPSLQANMRGIIVNRMKGPEPSPGALGALEAYVRSLGYPPNSNLNADGTPSAGAPAAAKRGYEVFMRAGCQACHLPPTFEKKEIEDIFSGGKFKVPSLRVVSLNRPLFSRRPLRDARAGRPLHVGIPAKGGNDGEADGERSARPGRVPAHLVKKPTRIFFKSAAEGLAVQ